MQATQNPTLADRRAYRLTDLQSSLEAAAALKATAARTRPEGAVGDVLNAATAILGDGLQRGDEPIDDANRNRLRAAATSAEFLAAIPFWVRELREAAEKVPSSGACTVASALELWAWTVRHLRTTPQALDDLAEALLPLVAARSLALDVVSAPDAGDVRVDLSHVHAARAASAASGTCASAVFGYRQHLAWDAEGCATCYSSDRLDELEVLMPGITSGASLDADVIEADGSHPKKAGPCVKFEGLEPFFRLRNKLDGCLTGSRLARDRAAVAVARSMDAMFPTEGK